MSLFSRLFGGGGGSAKPEPEAVDYEGYKIYPDPINEGGRFRVGARIEKAVDGEVRSHHLIRADLLESHDAAADISIAKAKSMIDQMGDGIFS